MKSLLSVALVGTLGAACGEPGSAQPGECAAPAQADGARALTRAPAAHASHRTPSLCELMGAYHDVAGAFVVRALTSHMEHDPLSGAPHPFTYARLEAVEAWSDTPAERHMLRLRGGVTPSGLRTLGDVELEPGMHLVGFFRQRADENCGHLQAIGPTVFRPTASGGLTNGMHFVSEPVPAGELRDLFETNAKPTFACRSDVLSEREDRE